MAYPGGKNGAGVYQTLINLIPPHEVYIDIDPAVVDMWQTELQNNRTAVPCHDLRILV